MPKNRKKIRLQNFDYSQNGYYFVTICAKDRKNWFGEILAGKVILNSWGLIVVQQWQWLATQYNYIQIDQYSVMPDHFHGILAITRNGHDRSLQQKVKSLSQLIGAFKTTSSKLIRKSGFIEFQWQKSFYEHIIRSEKSLDHIRLYIEQNPLAGELEIQKALTL